LKNSYKIDRTQGFQNIQSSLFCIKSECRSAYIKQNFHEALINARMTHACSAWEICGRHVAFEIAMPAGRTVLLADDLLYCGIILNFADKFLVGRRRRK
jgi:hypothetical protein